MSLPITRTGLSSSDEKLINLVGTGKEFLPSEVPTLRDIIRKGIEIQQGVIYKGISRNNFSVTNLAKELTELVINQWHKSNASFQPPVTIDTRTIALLIEKKWNILREISRGKAKKGCEEKIMPFLDKLFDITACKCEIYLCDYERANCTGCPYGAHISCSCPQKQKIPLLELRWLYYQRQKVGEKSQFQMALKDIVETQKNIRAVKRKMAEMDRKAKSKKVNEAIILESSSEKSASSNDSAENHPSKNNYNRDFQIMNTAAASIRFGVSQRATAAITSGFLQDLVGAGYLTEEAMNELTCDPKKIFRAKKCMMTSTQVAEKARVLNDEIQGIFFDGRDDTTKTLTLKRATNKYYPSLISEEHYTITQEPEGKYLHHFSPSDFTSSSKGGIPKPAKRIALGLYDWLESHDAHKSLQVIGGDSTNTITGWQGGAIAHLKKLLGKKCMWLICMIHLNELPLRHLIENLVGKTMSADKFKGEIGKLLPKLDQFPINYNFKALPDGDDLIYLPEDIVKSLSTDQQNCYLLVKAIKSGILPKDLANKKGGPINHSRWLTTAQAFLMLWVRHHNLQGESLRKFELIVKFIIQSYFKLYFDIKIKNSMVEGPNHILTTLRLFRKQPKEVQNIIKDTISRGAYHAHSENVLLALLCSNLEEERVFAIEKFFILEGLSNWEIHHLEIELHQILTLKPQV